MQLKEYQTGVLDSLSRYLDTLAIQRTEVEDFVEFQKSRGREVTPDDWCRKTWETLAEDRRIPIARDRQGNALVPPYVPRFDGLKRPVPNICLKVPTGGGKTLLGCAALERIFADHFKRQTGFVLWVVPSDAIYSQTWRAFANREHPYRQMLERASGGRVKLLERNDAFTKADVEQQLCVMLLMLQASARKTKEQLKMFQDSGRFPSFFPEVDGAEANRVLLRSVLNLDTVAMDEAEFRASVPVVRQSLGNVLRLTRPVIVVDEGHKAYSETALGTLCGFNPAFILEMSATPNSSGEHVSNVLVDVHGKALKDEQMIKLPLNLINLDRADWKHALNEAHATRERLEKAAERVRGDENRYVRPIVLVRVDRTGKEQRDKGGGIIHAEDVREYLRDKLGVPPEQIKVKSAELDELGDTNLLAEDCDVRFVITKDALREGWDCPFAYVLAVLSNTTAQTALTQMVGRILRQPGAQVTTQPPLNESYVVTFDKEVSVVVESVKRGLEQEGMGDLGESVRVVKGGVAGAARVQRIPRREKFKDVKVFLPRVLSRRADGQWRVFDYERDLLPRLDWEGLHYRGRNEFSPDDKERLERTETRLTIEEPEAGEAVKLVGQKVEAGEFDGELDIPFLVRLLLDVIPNPWQGVRILNDSLAALRARGFTELRIHANRLALIKAMKEDLRQQVHAAGEAEFRRMLEAEELTFRLEVSGDEKLNWALAETLELEVGEEDHEQYREDGTPLQRALFEKIYRKQLNGLERDVAWYLDGKQAVRWWHRIAVHQDWHLQGWQRARVYPDFLACLEDRGDGKLHFTVLETKGLHLKGNDDTAYKERLFDLLTAHSQTALNVGEMKLGLEREQMRFELLLENNWSERIERGLAS